MNDTQLQALMQHLDDAAARNMEAPDEFDLPDPLAPTHHLFIGNAAFPEETYWIICRQHAGDVTFLGRGAGRQYVDCCYLGCPERVRQDCILDRESVLEFASMLPSIISDMQVPWHWVSFEDIFARIESESDELET